MTLKKTQPCRKKEYQKIGFDLKLSIIDQINNGQISVNHASNKYNVSRSSIDYWLKKLSNFESKSKVMSKNDELKKLREKVEELEFIKELQQDIIIDFQEVTGKDLAKKLLPKVLAKEIETRKRNRLK